MRIGLLMLFLLVACADEPSFDEQFEKQSAEIEAEAKKLDKDLKSQIELLPEVTDAKKSDLSVEVATE